MKIRFRLERRFWVASMTILTIFCINLYGLYGDGFSKKYYLVPEIEHLLTAFFLAMWLSCFSPSIRFVIIGLIVFTGLWEGLEYYIATVPSAARTVQEALKVTDTAVETWDTALDICLNFVGASIFIYTDRRQMIKIASGISTIS